MKDFADLVTALSTSTKTNEKLDAMVRYFQQASDKDRIWVIALFTGRRPKRTVSSTLLKQWCIEITGLSNWLFDESYHTVGDLAEAIALLLPEPSALPQDTETSLSEYLETFISLGSQDESIRKSFITGCWVGMNVAERFVFNKLITGGFRIGVSQKMMVNALAKTVDLDPSVIAHRISGAWDPVTTRFEELLSEEHTGTDLSKPYPFYLAYALEAEPDTLGTPEGWQAEWKWDGIRGQIIKRQGELFVWSRGEELITEKFPEYGMIHDWLPDGTCIDGEIISLVAAADLATTGMAFMPMPFSALQTRIGRKTITKKQLKEAPVGFIAYDLIEYEGADIRQQPLQERRLLLEALFRAVHPPHFVLSPIIPFEDWAQLTEIRTHSRELHAEGLMLKHRDSVYKAGRKTGDWWKWKVTPLTIDCVMIYAQKGHGRRSNLYTDYTFAVKDGDKLVPFTKAYSGLTDREFAQVDSFVKRNSLEKFGPVRTVKPELVFEIAFEGIAASNRHKSGVALRFPRMLRWRHDKKPDDINTLDDLKQLLAQYGKMVPAEAESDR